MIQILDAIAIFAALMSSWLWFKASRHRLRRIERSEVIDSADLNRIVVAINRTQILNSRAAFATAISAFVVALRLCANLLELDR